MERERPEYLPAIQRSRWNFPWLFFIAVVLAALAAAGVHMLLKTNAAWTTRFQQAGENLPPATPPDGANAPSAPTAAQIAEIRLRRAAAEAQIQGERRQADEGLKCIDGTTFRRIPGGWENVPGRRCTSTQRR